MDSQGFQKRVNENKDRLRSKIRELNQAKKIYLELLNI
jgi:hypothetical protein